MKSVLRVRLAAVALGLAVIGIVQLAQWLFPETIGGPAQLAYLMILLPGFTGVGAGQIAIAEIPRGLAYRGLLAAVTNNAADPNQASISTEFTRWHLKVNGVTKWDLTGAQLASMNAYHGHADSDGVRSLWLTQPKQSNMYMEDVLLYGTNGLDTFNLEVTIAGTAINPTMALYALIDTRPLPLGLHRVVQAFPEAIGGASEFNTLNLPPRIKGRYFEKAHYLASANAINAARVSVNNQDRYNALRKVATSLNGAQYSPFTWQAGYFHIDMTVQHRISDALSMNLQDLRVFLTATGAMTATGIWEMLDANGGPGIAAVPVNTLKSLGLER